MKYAALLLACLILSGCCLLDPLPDGKAPDGAILHNTPPKKFDFNSAVNYMTTSLSIYLLTDPLPENFLMLDTDEATRFAAESVLEEISRVTGIRRKTPCGQVLRTRAGKNSWEFILDVNGRTLWKEHLDLNLMSEAESVSNNQQKGKK